MKSYHKPGETWISLDDLPDAVARGYTPVEIVCHGEHGARRMRLPIPGCINEQRKEDPCPPKTETS